MAGVPLLPLCWFDGSVRDVEDVRVHPFTSSLMYATGCFEGLRSYKTPRGTAVFRLREHMERFERSASAYGIRLAYSVDELSRAVLDTLRANDLDDGYIRPVAFFGLADKALTLAPKTDKTRSHVAIGVRRHFDFLGGGGKKTALKVTLSPYEKVSSRAMPSTSKTAANYASATLAYTEALERGFDEAIMLNVKGEVAEGTVENVFVVRDGAIHTNDETADILPGITRDSVIALARDQGIPVQVRALTLSDLRTADEMFMTGTAAEVKAVEAFDDIAYGPHPITDRLAAAYRAAATGHDDRHHDWLTFVPVA